MEGELEILLGELHIKMKGAQSRLQPHHRHIIFQIFNTFACRSDRLRPPLPRRPIRGETVC